MYQVSEFPSVCLIDFLPECCDGDETQTYSGENYSPFSSCDSGMGEIVGQQLPALSDPFVDDLKGICAISESLPNCCFLGKPIISRPPEIHSRAIPVEIMRKHMSLVLKDLATDDPFYVADIGEVVRQHNRWVSALPLVKPFYAVKCNPEPIIMRALGLMGTGFDCASKAEIKAVLDLGIGLDPGTCIIYANPCKAASHIRYAASVGVRIMTFDNADELHKIKRCHPNPLLVLRILTDDSRSVCRFGVKFGASLAHVQNLLLVAKSLCLDVIGISFHVGSGCFDATAFSDAIVSARSAFDIGAEMGFNFTLLDIGGGFPGAESHTGVKFSEIVDVVRPKLSRLFPNTTVISEPGRYFVSSAYTLAVNVHARRRVVNDETEVTAVFIEECLSIKEGGINTVKSNSDNNCVNLDTSFMYYVNEGLYSSLNCVHFDHALVHPQVLFKDNRFCHGEKAEIGAPLHKCSIWGPTCDSMDLITKTALLPELNVGDWLYFDWMGAYTVAASSTFNGFAKATIFWTNTETASLDI